jgi:16S rRNA A1518/A1519 N6-dimethyltransferase RsmA/KsgA/DIM1 with predicted DNA glycosylase/AP lyase activity
MNEKSAESDRKNTKDFTKIIFHMAKKTADKHIVEHFGNIENTIKFQ